MEIELTREIRGYDFWYGGSPYNADDAYAVEYLVSDRVTICVEDEAYIAPAMNTSMRPNFCETEACSFSTIGIGYSQIMMSVMMLMPV